MHNATRRVIHVPSGIMHALPQYIIRHYYDLYTCITLLVALCMHYLSTLSGITAASFSL